MFVYEEPDNNLSVVWASPSDVCNICLADYLNENKDKEYSEMNSVIAREALKGKLLGSRVFKLKYNNYCICKMHLDLIREAIEPKDE